MGNFNVEFSRLSKKQLKKIDKIQQVLIKRWIDNHLINCLYPRQHGKALSGSLQKYWSYRIGHYRVICEIDDTNKIIQIITIGHRSDIYNKIVREEELIYDAQ